MLSKSLIQDKNYPYAILLVLGSIYGLKLAKLLALKWGDLINESGEYKSNINISGHEFETRLGFTSDFMTYLRKQMINQELTDYIFVNQQSGKLITNQRVNRELRAIQNKYQNIVSMPYGFDSDTHRRVFGIEVWKRHHYQNNAITSLRKFFGHGSDRITREFLMIPPREKKYSVDHICRPLEPDINMMMLLL